ncbi:MAG TPA: ATPase, T2SS/T4P/T4SS family [Vicinamibacterales bacterium]|nr:ATPase, T2SS/T4P/T4SS family [Vicinamibacterales bacterium]
MSPSEYRLGELLIERRLITTAQLEQALRVQQESAKYLPLGQILIDSGLITRRQLHLLLAWAQKQPKLGEVLIKSRAIDAAQLSRALAEQKKLELPLGETLVKLGYLTEEAMRQALCLQMNVPYLDLDRMNIDPMLARLVNRSYAVRHRLVPVARVAETLTVAMDDPSDAACAEELAQSTGCSIRVVTSSSASIQEAIARVYDPVTEEPTESVTLVAVSDPDSGIGAQYSQENRRADGIVRQLMHMAIERQASDVHLEPVSQNKLHVRFRIDGVLQKLNLGSMQQACHDHALGIVSRIKILAKLDIAERRRPQDGSFRLRADHATGERRDFDLRVSVVPSYYGESVVVRILDRSRAPDSIEQLGFPAPLLSRLKELLKRPNGILLVTGPTGAGKSTSLYAALKTVYRPQIRVVTAEDPIEYVYEQFSQSEVNERIGNTFASYLRAFLRHDPEVMMVGEIRDEETTEMALRAAQTGHLLLSTLHTSDAVSAVTRLLDLKADPTLISSSLIGVLSQRLVRTVCADCHKPYQPSTELMREFFEIPPPDFKWLKGQGCRACDFTGYRGRRVVAELWTPNETDIILINRAAPFEELRASAARTTFSMAESALCLLKDGQTNLEELIRTLPYASVYRCRELVPVLTA